MSDAAGHRQPAVQTALNDPIARRLMKGDGVDREALERLLDQIAHFLKFGHGDRVSPRGSEQI